MYSKARRAAAASAKMILIDVSLIHSTPRGCAPK